MRLIVELQKCGEVIALDFPAFFNVRHLLSGTRRRLTFRASKRLSLWPDAVQKFAEADVVELFYQFIERICGRTFAVGNFTRFVVPEDEL